MFKGSTSFTVIPLSLLGLENKAVKHLTTLHSSLQKYVFQKYINAIMNKYILIIC